VVPWIVNAFQTQYRHMEQVAQIAEMQLANSTEPAMENYQRKKRETLSFWNLVKEQCKPQERLHAPFIRDRTPEDSHEHLRQKRFVAPFVLGFIWSRLALQKGNRTAFVPENTRPLDFIPDSPEAQLLPRERRETRSIKPELAAQINRTAQILQALMNPGLGLPADRLLQQVEKDLNSTAQDVSPPKALDYILDQINRTAQILQIFLNPGLGPRAVLNLANGTFTSAQDYNLATRRSQNLSTFAVFSLIMAFLMAAILVAGICAQLGLKAEEDLEKTPLPIIKMTSIIEPEDITSDVLPLVRTDPQGNGIIGETP
jgi:hypothetical protein